MKKPLIIIFIITVFQLILYSQHNYDSLLLDIKNTKNHQNNSIALNDFSKTFKYSIIDSAIFYAKKGLTIANDYNDQLGIAENAASLGDYYILKDSLVLALEYYLLSNQNFKKIDNKYDYAQISKIIGNIYLSRKNYSEALLFYQKSQIISEEQGYSNILPHIYNNIGIIYYDLNEREKSLSFFLKAYNGFKAINAKDFIPNSVQNIANIYYEEHNDSIAIKYYYEALNMTLELNNYLDAASILNEIGKIEMIDNNIDKAINHYLKAYELINNTKPEYDGPKSRVLVVTLGNLGIAYSVLKEENKSISTFEQTFDMAMKNNYMDWIESSSYHLSKIYENKGQLKKALQYFKIYKQYGDSIINENSIKKITQLEMQFDFDKKMKEITLKETIEKASNQKKELIFIIIIGLFIFILIIAFLLFANQRNKTAKVELKRSNLELEHQKLQQELEHKNKELATNVMYLLSKNEFITKTAEKLSHAKFDFKKENQKIIQDIIRELLMNSSKDVWKEFEIRFQEVHSKFYNNLNKIHPDLTPNEKKICAFLRLNMSTKDISAITYQSTKSINMARFRLRKKMNLDTDENLINILSNF